MQEINLDTVQAFNDYHGLPTLHPLVSVVHVNNTEHIKSCKMRYGLYAFISKRQKPASYHTVAHHTTSTR